MNRFHFPLLTLLGETSAGKMVVLAQCLVNRVTPAVIQALLTNTTLALQVSPRAYLTCGPDSPILAAQANAVWPRAKRLLNTCTLGPYWYATVLCVWGAGRVFPEAHSHPECFIVTNTHTLSLSLMRVYVCVCVLFSLFSAAGAAS